MYQELKYMWYLHLKPVRICMQTSTSYWTKKYSSVPISDSVTHRSYQSKNVSNPRFMYAQLTTFALTNSKHINVPYLLLYA